MKKILIFSLALLALGGAILGCTKARQPDEESKDEADNENEAAKGSYKQITQAEAKALMDSEKDYTILDVRTQTEYDEGHIEGAILIPDYDIEAKAESVLTDKSRLILVYCRSGRRSKIASEKLAEMGYTNVREFGGINDWQYGTVTD